MVVLFSEVNMSTQLEGTNQDARDTGHDYKPKANHAY